MEATINLKRIGIIGLIFWLVGYSFGIIETIYFGSNWFPESKEEFLCDIASLALSYIGFTLIMLCLIIITNKILASIKAQREKIKSTKRTEVHGDHCEDYHTACQKCIDEIFKFKKNGYK